MKNPVVLYYDRNKFVMHKSLFIINKLIICNGRLISCVDVEGVPNQSYAWSSMEYTLECVHFCHFDNDVFHGQWIFI